MNEKDFCCEDMHNSIEKYKIVDYEQIDRTYGILFGDGYNMFLQFCPWCGVKLKHRLVKELFKCLKTEYKIEEPDLTNFTNVPEEFKSDEWWKKRGL
ncbi:hypothetical protein NOVO_09085 [Rickettsiales bacterium Ac37b]|nr:hypothetical protein NOVO_09085 [Rickettsiales bacterium Ac37b]